MELKSPTTGIPVSEAQYITELIIQNKARREKSSLSPFFWKDKLWKKEYSSQIMAANSLLKIFRFDDIVSTLKDKNNLWIVSLRTKTLEDKIIATKIKRERQEKFAQENLKHIPIEKTDIVEEPLVLAKPQKKDTLKNLLD